MALSIIRESGFRITPEGVHDHLPTPDGRQWITMLARGGLEVELYAPHGKDLQTAHSRDELYFIVRGAGDFVLAEKRHPFAPGDAFFVPAGIDHRFEHFSDDFLTWVVFSGPDGGDHADGAKIADSGVALLD